MVCASVAKLNAFLQHSQIAATTKETPFRYLRLVSFESLVDKTFTPSAHPSPDISHTHAQVFFVWPDRSGG
jgi:hypothetical protein